VGQKGGENVGSQLSKYLLGLVAILGLALPGSGVASRPTSNAIHSAIDIIHVGTDLNDGEPLPLIVGGSGAGALESTTRAAVHTPVVGEERTWVGLDDVQGALYSKQYRLRALGEHVEIWVATGTRTFRGITSSDTDFQLGDCRNGVRTQITDAQVDYLKAQFDENIYPKESAAFSVPPDRDGSHALLGPPFDPTGDGDDIVVLVDNVRDDNFYDFNNTQAFSYIAGFFSSQINTLFDRNVMTIDAFDWLHRTGANPPHEPVPGDNCASAPARPFLYEGVFAHEYQHLLEQYEDPDESTWLNEGLSDWAQTLTGYVNPATPITQIGFDSHVQCFLGYLGIQTDANPIPRLTSGPENSLTRWEDQGPGEILCDYGAAYTTMEYAHGQFGTDFMTALHRGDAHGLDGLQEALDGEDTKLRPMDVLHNWTLMVAVDGLIDDGARILGPYEERLFTAPTLDATINWDTEHAFSTPGAPSNGSDYVRFRNAAGAYVSGGNITSLSFDAAETLPAKPIAWSVAADPPFTPGDPALFSGAGNNRDEMIIRSVAVPTGAGATLTFDALWNQELGWDFLFAQVSTDGGSTYSSLTCTDTTTETNPDALPTAKENVPGFTGYSGGWRAQTCSLAAYAGQTVLLAFRTFNDPAVLGESAAVPPGAWVDDVSVGGTLISDGSTLAGWQSRTQVSPTSVSNFTVQILSIAGDKITVKRLPLTGDFAVHGAANVEKYIDRKAAFVAAIVTYEDPAESSDQYAPYTLTVNGVVQPGGGM
jgi:Immune inhibitor A peptidase M6